MRRRRRHEEPTPKRRHDTKQWVWFLPLSLMINLLVVPQLAGWLLKKTPVDHQPVVVEIVDANDKEQPKPAQKIAAKKQRLSKLKRAKQKKPARKKEAPPKKKKLVKKLQEPPKKTPPVPPLLKMVEVNNPESKKPPALARFLSDKNRTVKKETRARHTNMVKDDPRPRPVSQPKANKKKEAGAKKIKIAELKRLKSPKKKISPPPLRIAMREKPTLAPDDNKGEIKLPKRRIQLEKPIDHQTYDAIMGEQAVKQRTAAKLDLSAPREGRFERKLKRIRLALENFVPEVRPGNQTALSTRANPFAVYIARMHRKIHRLWGYGFLEDLNNKPDRNPMNDMKLWTMVEVIVKPDGTVRKTTVVRPSGLITFDVAALDTVLSSAPFSRTPRAIRSKDGDVYMHWRFHRDQRQCGTFGVSPYILNKPAKGPIDGGQQALPRSEEGEKSRQVRRLNRPGGGQHSTDHHHAANDGATPPEGEEDNEAQPITKNQQPLRSPLPTPTEEGETLAKASAAAKSHPAYDWPGAKKTAQAFIGALASADFQRMTYHTQLPFSARGKVVARDLQTLAQMFRDLTENAKSVDEKSLELMTPMQARAKLRHLPRGATDGNTLLIGRFSLGREPIELLLKRNAHGLWKISGLNR